MVKKLLIVLASGAALIGCVLVLRAVIHRPGVSSAPPEIAEVRPVKVVRAKPASLQMGQSYTGIVRARYESDLGFRVGGKVVARLVDVGDTVKAGQPLLRLDATDYQLAVAGAEAELTAAEAMAQNAVSENERDKPLAPSGAVSQSELDRTRDTRKATAARVDQAARALDVARNRLAYCTLLADADGVVMGLSAEAGQVVAEGQPLIRIARVGDREAVVSIPENRVAEARASLARATLWSGSGPGFAATLRELSPTADPLTRTYQARFTLLQPTAEVTLGRTVTVHLKDKDTAERFAVPLTAITQQDGTPAVWLVSGDRLILTPVAIGEYREEMAIVTAGLSTDDVIVAAGVQKCDTGLRVRAWEDR